MNADSNTLARREVSMVSGDQWTVMKEQARILVQTGFLPAAIKTPEQAVAIMLKGRELGIPPMYALSNIAVIQGKPTCNSELMLALVYRDHGDAAVLIDRSDNSECSVLYKRRTLTQAKRYTFTLEDAKRAGLLSNQTWQKYPAAMLRARCISAVARMAFPDSIGGMYTPEELGAAVEVDQEGTVQVLAEVREIPAELERAADRVADALEADLAEVPTEQRAEAAVAGLQVVAERLGLAERIEPTAVPEAEAEYVPLNEDQITVVLDLIRERTGSPASEVTLQLGQPLGQFLTAQRRTGREFLIDWKRWKKDGTPVPGAPPAMQREPAATLAESPGRGG